MAPRIGFLFLRDLWRAILGLVALLAAAPSVRAADLLDATPRIAVMSAFEPELAAVLARTAIDRTVQLNGVAFTLGRLGGKQVVLFASGISMVNAAMTAQLVLDRFTVSEIVFSGIAGGVDTSLGIGDVSVPERWGQYLEAIFARETPDGFRPPAWAPRGLPAYGMIHPQEVQLRNTDHPGGVRRLWLDADPALLDRARKAAASAKLESCAGPQACLRRPPRVVVGGSGVSGQAFVDNAAFREYVARTFGAAVLDMETAAVAAVAFANKVPYVAFRSVSDIAGGGAGENEMATFMSLASVNAASVLEAYLAAGGP